MSRVLSERVVFVTVPEAAEIIGVTEGRVRQLLKSGDLDGQKLGRDWVVPKGEADRFAALDPPTVGRPRKTNPEKSEKSG